MIHLKYKCKVNFVKLPLIWIDLCLKLVFDAVHTRVCTGVKNARNSLTVQNQTHVYMNNIHDTFSTRTAQDTTTWLSPVCIWWQGTLTRHADVCFFPRHIVTAVMWLTKSAMCRQCVHNSPIAILIKMHVAGYNCSIQTDEQRQGDWRSTPISARSQHYAADKTMNSKIFETLQQILFSNINMET